MILTLQTATFSVFGGIPTYNRLFCRALNEFSEGQEKRVLVAIDKPAEIEHSSTALHRLQIEAYAGNRRAFVRRVLNLALTRRIDLALIGHVNYAPLGWLLRKLQPQLRYGVTVHGVDVWSKLPRWKRRALQQANFITSVSEYTKRQAVAVNGASADRFYLLPNTLEWSQEEIGAVSALPRLPTGTRLLTVCRLEATEQYKGVDTVIEALPAVIRQVPDLQYHVVGSGTDLDRHQELARKAGVAERVHFLGLVDAGTLRACYQSCDLFVMPSAGEGFGIVYLEAMQYAKAVVAAHAGATPEVVLDGITGLLVQYGNVQQLAHALTRLCLEPELRTQLGQAGSRRLQEKFTFRRFNQTLTDILLRELSSTAKDKARHGEISDSVRVL